MVGAIKAFKPKLQVLLFRKSEVLECREVPGQDSKTNYGIAAYVSGVTAKWLKLECLDIKPFIGGWVRHLFAHSRNGIGPNIYSKLCSLD